MLEEQRLHRVERHLREVLDPHGDFEEVANILSDLRQGGAQIVYQCNTHPGVKHGSGPVVGVMTVEEVEDSSSVVHLDCGHTVYTTTGEGLACLQCGGDCHT